jgi:cell wall-associated NlpC family hydrolase
MTNALGVARKTPALCISIAVLAMVAIATVLAAPANAETPGGVATTPPESTEATAPPGKAIIVGGRAIPPADAPAAVKKVIAAANKIRTKPYIYGGGHGRWWDAGYDCSGAVSFALFGGGLIPQPLTSGDLMRWGAPGRGRWITVYANAGHTFVEIAGLRFDTVGAEQGTGPRWHLATVSTAGYVARHPPGL